MKALTLQDLQTGLRFVREIPSFLYRPVSSREARTTLPARFENRNSDFLALMRRAVYENPASPYLALLKNVGCEYGDLRAEVGRQGLEAALRKLFQEGVFLTANELKGRLPVRRGTLAVQAGLISVRNPLAGRHLLAHSSGSTGQNVPVLIDLAYVRDRAVNHRLALEARGGVRWSPAVWGIPGNTDMVRVLELCALGAPPERWFSQVDLRSPGLHPRYRWSVRVMRWAGRMWGVALPRPETVPLSNPKPIIDWLAWKGGRGETAHVVTWASPAVRLCQAARKAGLGLGHVQFSIGGEPITAAKLATIQATGARAVPRFMAMECGYIAYGCLKPSFPDELHVFDDMLMVVQPEDKGPEFGLPPQALLLTTLRPTAPFILLNVSLGDQAQMMTGACGCPLEKLGWTKHLRQVRSFEKLTCGGMTFMDTDILKILEVDLPERFGGSGFDYQLVELEDSAGVPKIKLVVNPALGPFDPDRVKDFFLEAIGTSSGASRVMSLQWRDGGSLSVERAVPALGPSGKIIHILKKRT